MATKMLQDGFLDVMEARTRDDFTSQVVRFTQRLGFRTMTATVVLDRDAARTEFYSVGNAPEPYELSYDDTGLAQRDPVMQHCKRSAIPIIWDQDTYVARGLGDLWDHQAQFGYATGIALALHLPGGRHFFLGIDRDRTLSKNPRSMTRLVADLQLFAVHAQDTALRLFLPPPAPVSDDPPLTPRELEALRWTMEGKTAWEVGAIMHISERTAVLHLQNSMHKLGCINKHQAVLKAIRSGLLR